MFDEKSGGDRQALVNESGSVLPNVGRHSSLAGSEAKRAKKKKMIIGGVALLVVIAIAVLVLVLTLGRGSDDGPVPPSPAPGPDPPTPPTPPGPIPAFNPYVVEAASRVDKAWEMSGVVKADQKQLEAMQSRKQNVGASGKVAIDASTIPSGGNNPIIKQVRYEFGQTDYKTSYLCFTDAENERFSPPEDLVHRPRSQVSMRLDMVGFKMTDDPFGFSFASARDPSNVYVEVNKDSTFLMMDKYMQLDLQLPSQRLFGLGERNRQFRLEEGTWTMWANGQPTPHDDGSGGL